MKRHSVTNTKEEVVLLLDDLWILIILVSYHAGAQEESFARLWAQTSLFFPFSCAEIFRCRIVPALRLLPSRTGGLSRSLLRQCRGLSTLCLYKHMPLQTIDIQQFSNLTNLCLFTPHLCLEAIISLPKLTSLQFGSQGKLKNTEIAQLTRLQSLRMHGADTNDLCMKEAVELDEPLEPDIREDLTDETLSCLPRLRTLDIALNESLTGESFSTLSSLTQLKLYRCWSVQTQRIGLLTELRELFLWDYRSSPTYDLKHLHSLTQLEQLHIKTNRQEEVAVIAARQWPDAQIEYGDWLFAL